MNLTMRQHLVNYIGSFVEYDENNNSGAWCKYMQIKVHINVHITLKKNKKVKKPRGEWRFVKFMTKAKVYLSP